MNTNNMMNRIKKTTVGKVLRRLVGEDAGQAMMEYVIIAVLIAAACAAAMAYFAQTTAQTAGVAGMGMTGDIAKTKTMQKTLQTDAGTRADKGVKTAKDFIKE